MSESRLSALKPGQPAQECETARHRVLIVEDDSAICSSLSEGLREEGFAVQTAANGREALERLRAGTGLSVIVLDLMMPVMDGWDFRQEQLQDAALKDIPVVVITAAGFSTESIRTQFGNVALIPKPVSFRDLLVALRAACGSGSTEAAGDTRHLKVI